MAKYYFMLDKEYCYTLDYIYQYMEDEEIEELEVNEAQRLIMPDMFWCKWFEAPSEKGECGKYCAQYKPKNGIKGVCQHYGNFYESSGKTRILKLKYKKNVGKDRK